MAIRKGQTIQWPKDKGQTIQWPKNKGQTIQWPKDKGQTRSYKALYRKLNTMEHKSRGELIAIRKGKQFLLH
jgi:hypothetical protein